MQRVKVNTFLLSANAPILALLGFIRAMVESGQLKSGDQLPSPEALAEQINRIREGAEEPRRPPIVTKEMIGGMYDASELVERQDDDVTFVVVVPEHAVTADT